MTRKVRKNNVGVWRRKCDRRRRGKAISRDGWEWGQHACVR